MFNNLGIEFFNSLCFGLEQNFLAVKIYPSLALHQSFLGFMFTLVKS